MRSRVQKIFCGGKGTRKRLTHLRTCPYSSVSMLSKKQPAGNSDAAAVPGPHSFFSRRMSDANSRAPATERHVSAALRRTSEILVVRVTGSQSLFLIPLKYERRSTRDNSGPLIGLLIDLTERPVRSCQSTSAECDKDPRMPTRATGLRSCAADEMAPKKARECSM